MHELAVSVINKIKIPSLVQYDCKKTELPVTIHINEAQIISMVV
jgi:hypothetical protein